MDHAAFEAWGRRGLALADGNMGKIAGLCREWKCAFTVAAYPWPHNVKAGNPDSILLPPPAVSSPASVQKRFRAVLSVAVTVELGHDAH